ncbi:hypothetical protein [Falsiroseomonas stagni]|uniref:hypothetical protein n=1 Tax=Falsiroseomonas stagni TaxID=484882 RepID=UPI0011141C18|nr:hypothetical protein [Falsiroseomonas stagni]MBX9593767.1 hypothetical protein [Roseomonas sp.]
MRNDEAPPHQAEHDGIKLDGRAGATLRVLAVLQPMVRQAPAESEADRSLPGNDARRHAILYRCSAGSHDAIHAVARQRGTTPRQLITQALLAFGVPVLASGIDDTSGRGEPE